MLQVLLTSFHLGGWPCPFLHTLGIPCPGCGMSRATLFLIQGEWKQAFIMHAFAPVAVVALTLIVFCTLSPRDRAKLIADRAETFERYTGLTALLLAGLILYWLARLLILRTAFVRLIG